MATALLSYPDCLQLHEPELEASLLARSVWFMGSLMTIHADAGSTGGNLALIEMLGEPGMEPPLHMHSNEDELFYVKEGELKVFCGSEEIILRPGESGFLPRGVPHTFKILSEEARWLVYMTPGGFEDYFRIIGRPAESLTLDYNPPAPNFKQMREIGDELGLTFILSAV
jgi:quercetin dioxygenase-like cupin family protein